MDLEKDYSAAEYFVQRKVLDELHVDEVAQKRTWSTKPTVGEQVKESLRYCCGTWDRKTAVLVYSASK